MIEPMPAQIDQQQLAQELVDRARAEGVDLIGPGGLLNGLTKTVLETALEAEMSEHLGYDKHDPAGRNRGNSRNGTRPKTVLTEIGPVEIEGAAGSGGQLRAGDRGQAAAAARWDRCDRAVADRARPDHRGGRRALRRGLRRPGQRIVPSTTN